MRRGGSTGGGGTGGVNASGAVGDGNMAVWDGVSGTLIKDGGAPVGTGDVQGPASATTTELAIYNGATGKSIKTCQITVSASNVLKTPGAFWTDTIYEKSAASGVTIDGCLIKDGLVDGKDVSTLGVGDVVGPASATAAEIPLYSDATGKLLKTSQITVSASNVLKTPGAFWTNTIYENSAASGVTVDGVLIKDGAIAKSVVGLNNVTDDAQVKASIGTTKGDLISFSGAGAPVRHGVGADNSSLQSLAAATLGVRWVASGGAGDVTGPASSTVNLVPRFSNATGKALITSPIAINALGDVTGVSIVSRLGTATVPFKSISLDAAGADAGTLYFDAGTTKYLQCKADGTALLTNGFDFCNKDAGGGTTRYLGNTSNPWSGLMMGGSYSHGGDIIWHSDRMSSNGVLAINVGARISADPTYNYMQISGFNDGIRVTDDFRCPNIRTYPRVATDSSNYVWMMDDADPSAAIVSTGSVSLGKVGAGSMASNILFMGNVSNKGVTFPTNAAYYSDTGLAAKIGTQDVIIEFDTYFPKRIGSHYCFKIQKSAADTSQYITFQVDSVFPEDYVTLMVNNGATSYTMFYYVDCTMIQGYHRWQILLDRSTPANNFIKMDGIPTRLGTNNHPDTSGQDWDMKGVLIGAMSWNGAALGSTISSAGNLCSISNFKILLGADLTGSPSTTEALHISEAPKYGEVFKRVTTAADYTYARNDYLVAVTSTAATRHITIADVCKHEGQMGLVFDESGGAGSNSIYIQPASGNINGSSRIFINTNYGSVEWHSDGTNYFSRKI